MGKASEEIRRRLYKRAGAGGEIAEQTLRQADNVAPGLMGRARSWLGFGDDAARAAGRSAAPPAATVAAGNVSDDAASLWSRAHASSPRVPATPRAPVTPQTPPAAGNAAGNAAANAAAPAAKPPAWRNHWLSPLNPGPAGGGIAGNVTGGAVGFMAAPEDASIGERAAWTLGGAAGGNLGFRGLGNLAARSPIARNALYGQGIGTSADQIGYHSGLYGDLGIAPPPNPDAQGNDQNTGMGGFYVGPGTRYGGIAGGAGTSALNVARNPSWRTAGQQFVNTTPPSTLSNQVGRLSTGAGLAAAGVNTAAALEGSGPDMARNFHNNAIDERMQGDILHQNNYNPDAPGVAYRYEPGENGGPPVRVFDRTQSSLNTLGYKALQQTLSEGQIDQATWDRNVQYLDDPYAPEGTPRQIDWGKTIMQEEIRPAAAMMVLLPVLGNQENVDAAMRVVLPRVRQHMETPEGQQMMAQLGETAINNPQLRESMMEGFMNATGLGDFGEMFNNVLGFLGLGEDTRVGSALAGMNPLMKGLMLVGAIGLPLGLLVGGKVGKVGAIIGGLALAGGIAPAVYNMIQGNRPEEQGAETQAGQQNTEERRTTDERITNETQAANTYQHAPEDPNAWAGRMNTMTPDAVQAMSGPDILQQLATMPAAATEMLSPQVKQQLMARAQQIAQTDPMFAQQYDQLLEQIYANQQPSGSPTPGGTGEMESANVPGSALP